MKASLETHILTQIDTYLSEILGYTASIPVCIASSNRDFIKKPNVPSIEWTYNFEVKIMQPYNEQSQVPLRTELDNAFDLYRKAIGKEIHINNGLTIACETIASYERVTTEEMNSLVYESENINWVIKFNLIYKHIEGYIT